MNYLLRNSFEIFASFCLLIMAALAVAFLLAMPMAHAQTTQVCSGDGTACPALANDISNSLFKTDGASATVMVTGTITTRPPLVPNSMVYKDAVGIIRTASSTYVSNTGTANESLISANVNVLNGLTIPTAGAGVTPTAGDLVKTSTGVVCMRVNGVYKSLTAINVIVSGLLTPAIASPTNCVF